MFTLIQCLLYQVAIGDLYLRGLCSYRTLKSKNRLSQFPAQGSADLTQLQILILEDNHSEIQTAKLCY